jgi:hypothetical protein
MLKYRNAERHYAEPRDAKCQNWVPFILSVIVLGVVVLIVVVLSVMAL